MPRTYFFWDPVSDNILQERDENGNVTAEYTTEPGLHGNLISQNRGGVESQYHFDPQGSTLALTDDNQQVTDTYAFNAFGEVTARTGDTVNPFQFVGQHGYYTDDVTGNLIVRQSTLWTEMGRLLSVDTGIVGASYAYVQNNPCLFIDPSGQIKVLPANVVPEASRGCGKEYWIQWLFGLDKPAPCDGFIVQNVLYACRREPDCLLGCPLTKNADLNFVTYWEAWRVKANTTVPIGTVDHTDEPRSRATDLQCGEVMSIGIVRFFCEKGHNGTPGTGNLDELWKPLGKSYGAEPCKVTATRLPSRGLPVPSFWLSPAVEGPAFNWFRLNWDCCPCHNKFVEFTATPGE